MGFPYQTRRVILPGWTQPPAGYRRCLRLIPFRDVLDKEGWAIANARMNPHDSHPSYCERCPTHLLYIVTLGQRFPRLIGEVCVECGTLRCDATFDASDGPWAKLGWIHGMITWFPGDLVGSLYQEFLEWFREPPAPAPAPPSSGPYR